MFAVPTSTATSLTANITSTLADPGFLALMVIAVAIPLVFYVAHQLIGLLPKARGRKQ